MSGKFNAHMNTGLQSLVWTRLWDSLYESMTLVGQSIPRTVPAHTGEGSKLALAGRARRTHINAGEDETLVDLCRQGKFK